MARKAQHPRNAVTERAMLEEIFHALIDAEWPATERAFAQANSVQSIESWERHTEFTSAKQKYDALLEGAKKTKDATRKASNVDALVKIAKSNEDLLRLILSNLVRGKGTPRGSRNPEQHERAKHARHLDSLLKSIWPALKIKGLPAYRPSFGRKVIAAFAKECLMWPTLPPGWHKTH